MKKAKAVVAGIGSTLTALMTMLTTISFVLDDDAVDVNEIGSLATAVVTLGLTIWAVWRVPNAGMVDEEEFRVEMLRTGKMPGRGV